MTFHSSLHPAALFTPRRLAHAATLAALVLSFTFGGTSALAQAARGAAPGAVPTPPALQAIPATPSAAIAPAPAANQASYAERALTGAWYGESAASGATAAQLQRFLTTRRPDGTYSLEVRTYENGKPTVKLTNNGLWGISNGLFFTVITEVNGQRTVIREPSYSAAYLVRGITGNEFVYQHIGTGRELRVVRVAPDTRLPD